MSNRFINAHYGTPMTAVIREGPRDNNVLSPLHLGKIKEKLVLATKISSKQACASNHTDIGPIKDDRKIDELSNERTWDSVAVLLRLKYSHRLEFPDKRLLGVFSDE
jgi:hypothetical protein